MMFFAGLKSYEDKVASSIGKIENLREALEACTDLEEASRVRACLENQCAMARMYEGAVRFLALCASIDETLERPATVRKIA